MKHLYYVTYGKQMTSASWMHEAGHPNPALWDNPEECGWEGGGGFRIGGTHVYLWPIDLDGKNHHNIVK